MFHASELVAFVLSMVGMPYWYGTCVYICTSDLLKSKSRQYPSHYGSSRASTYQKAIAAGKVCADCIGLIKGFFWTNGGKGVLEYINGGAKFTNKYGSNGCPDKGANGMLEWLKAKGCKHGKINTLPDVPGILLFKSGHVGVYIGGGWAVEAQGFAYGIVKTKVSKRPWTDWAYLPASLLNYDDAAIIAPKSTVTDKAPVTEAKLGSRTLKRTSPLMTGADVKELQTRLNALGYNCGTADGEFGKNTENGVKAFQTVMNLEVDGEFGKKSFAALESLREPVVTSEPEPQKPSVETTEQTFKVHGFIPDVSVYQGEIDMDAFCAGNDFAIFRARVNGKPDSKFPKWAAELKKRGFPFAVYDYLRLKSKEDAIAQADAMYAVCSPYDPKIYYLDTEQLADGVTYAQEREFIKAYANRLRERGVKVIGQYTGDYRWRTSYRDLEPIFDTLWIASWGKNDGVYTGWTLNSAKYTDKIHLHQFTSNGYTKTKGAPGINRRIDLNRLTGAKPLSWFTGRQYEGEAIAEPESKIDAAYTTYAVGKGDTLWGIAQKLLGQGAKYKAIMELNGLNSTMLHTGDVLKIPEKG